MKRISLKCTREHFDAVNCDTEVKEYFMMGRWVIDKWSYSSLVKVPNQEKPIGKCKVYLDGKLIGKFGRSFTTSLPSPVYFTEATFYELRFSTKLTKIPNEENP